jgi:threonine dehydratase
MIALPNLKEIVDASHVVYESMPPTPEYTWPLLNARAGCEVWVKHENHGPVGAFKLRGGLVYMDWLSREQPGVKTVVSATRGNHGQSVALAAKKYGIRAVIVVPEGNSREKNAAMRALGAELIEVPGDFQAANHSLLVTGVASYALEFLTNAPRMDTVYVPIGMASGAAAVIAVRDALGLKTSVVGVTSSLARATALSFATEQVVEAAATTQIADGVACRKPDETALVALCEGLDRIVEVDDAEVESAIRAYFTDTHNVAEGAGAIGLAAILKEKPGGRVGTVLSGGNVDSDVFARVLAAHAVSS